MLPKVRKVLSENVVKWMDEKGFTWDSLQKLKKAEHGAKVGWSTMWKICRDKDYMMPPHSQEKLLDMFEIPFNNNYGIITLVEESEYEKQD